MSPTLETDMELVRRLTDETEIRNVIIRFCRGSDRMDIELLRSCYHPDATDAHGAYNGPFEGFIEWSERYNADKVVAKLHHLGQPLIELDGDTAWSETSCVCIMRVREADGSLADKIGVIRYVDLFERRGGEWRIAHRKVIHQPPLSFPAGDTRLAPLAFLAQPGTSDPSYDRRPESFLP